MNINHSLPKSKLQLMHFCFRYKDYCRAALKSKTNTKHPVSFYRDMSRSTTQVHESTHLRTTQESFENIGRSFEDLSPNKNVAMSINIPQDENKLRDPGEDIKAFSEWLQKMSGGGKSDKAAVQMSRRVQKILQICNIKNTLCINKLETLDIIEELFIKKKLEDKSLSVSTILCYLWSFKYFAEFMTELTTIDHQLTLRKIARWRQSMKKTLNVEILNRRVKNRGT